MKINSKFIFFSSIFLKVLVINSFICVISIFPLIENISNISFNIINVLSVNLFSFINKYLANISFVKSFISILKLFSK